MPSLATPAGKFGLLCLFLRHLLIGWYLAQTSSFPIGCSAVWEVVASYPLLRTHFHYFSTPVPEKGCSDRLVLWAVRWRRVCL